MQVWPRQAAEEYLEDRNIVRYLEMLTSTLLFFKPADPRAFLISRLSQMKEASVLGQPMPAFFAEEDLVTMFTMFDAPGNGTITERQANEGLRTLGVSRTLPPGTGDLTCEKFVSIASEEVFKPIIV